MTPTCSHRPPCPGCPAFGASIDGLPIVAQLGALAARVGARWTLHRTAGDRLTNTGGDGGHRQRARLAIRGRAGRPKLGIFEAGSHRIVDIPRCPAHHPRINAVAAELRAAIRASGLPPYTDGSHRGLLRYAQIMLDRTGERAQLTIVTCGHDPDETAPLWSELQARLGGALQGLFWNGQPERSNAILGPRFVHIAGEAALEDRVAGARVFFPPSAFAQSNPHTYEQIVTRLGSWVNAGQSVLELYAGVGAIGLSLMHRARRVAFNELSGGSLAGLARGIAALPPGLRARAAVLPGRAGERAADIAQADVLIVDPPRKGLDPELLDALADPERAPEQVLYVSCGPASLIAETQRLSRSMRLVDLEAFDLFPWTGHVEALARFVRA